VESCHLDRASLALAPQLRVRPLLRIETRPWNDEVGRERTGRFFPSALPSAVVDQEPVIYDGRLLPETSAQKPFWGAGAPSVRRSTP
jgi:hypothetical protein